MTLEEAKQAFEELKAQGETDETILAVLYEMYKDDTIGLDELESLIGVLGYEFTEEFKKMSPKDKKTKGYELTQNNTIGGKKMKTNEIKDFNNNSKYDKTAQNASYGNYNEEVKAFGKNYRPLNHYVMDHTLYLCQNDPELINSIEDSKNNQYVVYHEETLNVNEDGPTTNIIVSNKRSFEAAKAYKGKKVAVLNFANNHKPGGSPWSAGAQEESLCRTSTLFPCLEAISPKYHVLHASKYHNGELDNLGNDDLIYTPGIVVIKTDESAPLLLDQSERFNVDIITAAAPEVKFGIDNNTLYNVLASRIEKILQSAKNENVDVLILGAFGCGAFGNPPELVAKIFKEKLEKYSFDTVEFAVYCSTDSPNNNYHIFKQIV